MIRPPPRSTLFPSTTLFRSEIDPITLDIIENALRHARFEMDAVLFRSAMSPVIREQHDEFPMLTDPQGDRKSTRLNSSHANISYAVFCLKKINQIWMHYTRY